MKTKLFVRIICSTLLTTVSAGCSYTKSEKQSQLSSASVNSPESNKSHQQVSSQICPIPPSGHEKIPGYTAGKVNSSLIQKTLEVISPPNMNLGRGLISDVFTTIEFCGTAKENIVKVKLFTSNAGIKENQISSDAIKYSIGEATVRDGLWFMSYKFTNRGDRAVLAKGYDKDSKLVVTSSPVTLLKIYSPNP
jgi:hypothetical protein